MNKNPREKILEKILEKLNKEVYYEEPYKTWADFKEHEKIIEKATGVKSMAVLFEEVIDEVILMEKTPSKENKVD